MYKVDVSRSRFLAEADEMDGWSWGYLVRETADGIVGSTWRYLDTLLSYLYLSQLRCSLSCTWGVSGWTGGVTGNGKMGWAGGWLEICLGLPGFLVASRYLSRYLDTVRKVRS